MAIIKRANFKIQECSALDDDILRSASTISRDILLYGPKRTAFIKHDISQNLIFASNSKNLKEELAERNPNEWIIFRARAIDAGGSEATGKEYYGPNDNGDYFSEEELLKKASNGLLAFETFIGCPIFTNHKNDDIEQARGKIVNAFYDKDNHCVYIDAMVDAKSYPELARGIREAYITDVSMGCSVQWSECSICNNVAYTEKDYCDHVKNYKAKKFGGKLVYERNHDIKFIETSAVTDGACENCTIQNVYSGPELLQKLEEVLLNSKTACTNLRKVASLEKTAAGDDIEKLNQALDLLKGVAEKILGSKDVDFEFLEDIGGLLSELQNLIVDLVEAGFANQQAAHGAEEGGEPSNPAPPAPDAAPAAPEAMAPAPPMAGNPIAANEKMTKTATYLKGLSTIKSELKYLVASIKAMKDEIRTNGDKLMPTLHDRSRQTGSAKLSQKFAEILDQSMADTGMIRVDDGPYGVMIDVEKGITGFVNGEAVINVSADKLGDDIIALAKINPQIAAGRMIEQLASKFGENGEIKMNNGLNRKASETNAPPVTQVMEGQLNDMTGNFSRKNDEQKATGQLGVTIEKQLDKVVKSEETGNGDWGRQRPEGVAENLPVTETQLAGSRPTEFGSERTHNDAAPVEGQLSGVQEYQLAQAGYGSERWDDDVRAGDKLPVFESQFEGKDRLGNAVDEVQEGQLEGRRQGNDKTISSPASPHTAKNYATKVVKAFLNALSDVVVDQRINPNTLISVTPSVDGIKTAKSITLVKKASLTTDILTKVAEAAIASEIGVNMDLAYPYLKGAIETLYENPAALAETIGKMADKKIEQLKKIAVNEISTETVESSIKNSIKSAWRTASNNVSVPITINSEKLKSYFPGKFDFSQSKVDDGVLRAKIRAEYPTASIMDLRRVDDGYVASLEMPEEDAAMLQGQKVQQMPNGNPIQNNNNGERVMDVNDQHADQNPMEAEGIPLAASQLDSLNKIAGTTKVAQSPAGTTMPPPGGAAPAAPTGATTPPDTGMESLTQTPPPTDDLGDLGEEEESTGGEAKPFGSICFVCGSDDVDAMNGHFKCNKCAAEYDMKVNVELINPEEFADVGMASEEEGEDEDSEASDINDSLNAAPAGMDASAPAPMGAPAPPMGGAGAGAPPMGMAASNHWIKKAALQYEIVVNPMHFIKNRTAKLVPGIPAPIGSRCPQCSGITVAFKDSEGVCADCGCKTHVQAENNGGKTLVTMTVDHRLMIDPTRTNITGGHAFNAPFNGREAVMGALHEILSERNALVKIASTLEDSHPWIACQSDQEANGYAGEDALAICASLKSYLDKKVAGEDPFSKSEDDEDDTESTMDKETDDSVEFESDLNDEEGDDTSFESEEVEDVEDMDDGIEGDFEEIGMDEDDDNNNGVSDAVELHNIDKVTLSGSDAEGNPIQVDIETSGAVMEGDEGMEPSDALGIEDTFGDEMGDEGMEGDMGDEMGGESEGEFSLKGLFSSPIDKFLEEDEEGEEEGESFEDDSDDDDEFGDDDDDDSDNKVGVHKMERPELDERKLASNTTELLRGNRVASSNRMGGSNLDLSKLAQDLGMPLDTEVEVPRDEDEGIVEDGEVVSTHDHENEAKDTHGHVLKVDVTDDKSGKRGVSVITPDNGSFAGQKSSVKKAGIEDLNKMKGLKGPKGEKGGKGDDGDKGPKGPKGLKGPGMKKEKTEKCCGNSALAANGWRVLKAQTIDANPSEPIDAITEDKVEKNSVEPSLDIPRSPEKANPKINPGRSDVKNPTEVRKTEYGFGPNGKNLHTDVVPRDGSGDGLGGKSVTFEKEKGEDVTSGNPDSYLQEFQDQNQIKPTPAGNADNHAVASNVNLAVQHFAKATDADVNDLLGIEQDGMIYIHNQADGSLVEMSLEDLNKITGAAE